MKKKLFDKTNTVMPKNKVSTEVIATQINDPIVTTLVESYENIFSVIIREGIRRSAHVFKNNEIKTLIQHIDDSLAKRFGINFKHIHVENTVYQCWPLSAGTANAISEGSDSIREGIGGWLRELDLDPDKYTVDDVNDYEKDAEKLYMNLYNSIKSLNRSLNADGLSIDLQKATVKGLAKDFNIFLGVNFIECLDAQFTAREMAAILLHETGHVFSHLEYSGQVIKKSLSIVESIKDSVINKGKGGKETLRLVMEKDLNGNPNDVDNLEDDELIVTIQSNFKNVTSKKVLVGNNKPEVERVADQFSTRFGLGGDIVTGLYRLNTWWETGKRVNLDYTSQFFGNVNAVSKSTALVSICNNSSAIGEKKVTMLAASVILGFALAVGGAIYNIGKKIVKAVSKDTEESKLANVNNVIDPGSTYDQDYHRYLKVKLDIIRQMRTEKLPSELVSAYITQIEAIGKILALTVDVEAEWDKKVLVKIWRFFISSADAKAKLRIYNNEVEGLIENDIYTQAEKLKLLK